MNQKLTAVAVVLWAALGAAKITAQSADWQEVVWREPQVRYLLADMTLGGNTKLYRDYATAERDPDLREAIRLWDAGLRVVNTNEFERSSRVLCHHAGCRRDFWRGRDSSRGRT